MLSRTSSQRSVTIRSSVAEVLSKLRLSHHEESFALHCIDTYNDLEMLKDDQMRELGMWKVGERNRLVRWITRNLSERQLTEEADTKSPPLRAPSAARPPTPSSMRRQSFPPTEVAPTTPTGDQVTVSGAGINDVNGVYELTGMWDGVHKYSKNYFWKGKNVDLLLFRCQLMNDTKCWYISIVPMGQDPGTNVDIDFYSSPTVQDLADIPPEGGWMVCSPHGVAPPPTLACDLELSVVEDEWTADGTSAVLESSSRPPQAIVADPMSEVPPPPPSSFLLHKKIMIEGAGSPIINGVFSPSGGYDGAMIYKKGVYWGGKRQTISLFRCVVRGNQKRWYISFVPEGSKPGTSLDTDYYSASISPDKPDSPPQTGWVEAEEGLPPSPKLTYLALHEDEGDDKPESRSGSSAITVAASSRATTSTDHAIRFPTRSESSMATVEASTKDTTSTDRAVRLGQRNIRVHDAGLSFINGIYNPSGTFDRVPKFKKYAFYNGRDRTMTLFRCLVKGNKRRWYISIVPSRSNPGTIHDTDFYTAPAQNSIDSVPPEHGWVAVGEGRGKSPIVTVDHDDESRDTSGYCEEDDYFEEMNEDTTTGASTEDGETKHFKHDEKERAKVTPKASGSRKVLRWNPLGILTSKDSKSRLSLSGIEVEEINMPSVVTVNGTDYKEFQPIST